LSTDPLSVLETVGYRTGLAVWLDETNAPQIGLVIHSGGNLSELQRFTKIVEGLVGMSGENIWHPNAGEYQRVSYNMMEMDGNVVKYGFAGDYLVLGAGEDAFEKLMDTYRKDAPSIRENREFRETLKKLGSGVISAFADISHALSLIGDLDDVNRKRLAIFESLSARINLLEKGPLFQVDVQFNPNLPDNEIGMFMKKGETLKTPNAMSASDDLFVAIAPSILESVWELLRTEMHKNANDDTYAAIAFFEGLLNLNLEEDVMAGLTGEIALSVPDFTQFDPQALENINLEFDGNFYFDAGNVETGGAIIFNPTNRMKWNQIGNSLSNLQNISISQTDYNGTTVSGVDSSIYYGGVKDLFLLGFSEEAVYRLVDSIKEDTKPSYLKQVPKTPVAFAQVNVARALEIQKGAPPSDQVLVSSKEITPVLAWISIEDRDASFEIVLSSEQIPLEVLAKHVPFLVWAMQN
ncbi:DUF3352 domain-containing protein, partial [Candidatus Poribacteria bacterium]|nr:DUF3352 domain-containing protein [Candidatus Poribacteria bacterium]